MPQQVTTGARRHEVSGAARSSINGNGHAPADEAEWTYDELYEEARKRGLKGRSKMSKTELERALAV
jgi:hypothetical protein